eukprot:jgi/Tetstr1/436285/TSEL_025127.t1
MAPKVSLARMAEQREVRRREEEYKVQELDRYYGNARALESGFKAMEKDDVQRRRRENMERTREYNALETMYKTHKEAEISQRLADDTQRIAAALETKRAERERKDREIQSLMAGSEELRELQLRIRTAKMNKERSLLQLQEKAMVAEAEKEYAEQFDSYLAAELERQNATQAESDAARCRALSSSALCWRSRSRRSRRRSAWRSTMAPVRVPYAASLLFVICVAVTVHGS